MVECEENGQREEDGGQVAVDRFALNSGIDDEENGEYRKAEGGAFAGLREEGNCGN